MIDTILQVNSIFEQPWWLETVAPGRWGEVVLNDSRQIIARLPYVQTKNKLVMPPLTQTLGPWIHPDYRKRQIGNTQTSVQKEIIYELISKLPKHKSFDMIFDSSNEYILPYRWLGFTFSPTFSYRLQNLSNLDIVYNNFNKTVKKNIKSGQNKTTITTSGNFDDLYELLAITFSVQNRKFPHSQKQVEAIIEQSIKRNSGKILIAKDEAGNSHSGAFILYDERTCYYLLGGTDVRFRSSGAQSLVLWEAIQHAATVSKMFDFEGSMVEGIENFFRQFGGDQVLNYHMQKGPIFEEIKELIKPRIKKILHFKI